MLFRCGPPRAYFRNSLVNVRISTRGALKRLRFRSNEILLGRGGEVAKRRRFYLLEYFTLFIRNALFLYIYDDILHKIIFIEENGN